LQNLELGRPVDAVQFDTNQAKVALLRVADRPGIAALLFGELAQQSLDVDLIIQSIHEGNTNDIAFTVEKPCLQQAEAVSAAFSAKLGSHAGLPQDAAEVLVDRGIAKVSIIGAGMIGRPGVAAQMFSTLAAAGINLQMISTSEVNVSCTIAQQDCDRAIAALCEVFEVSNSPARLELEENLPPVRGVALDVNQAQLAIRCVPDRPGMAAQVFGILAAANISVDMIIQSQRSRPVNGIMTRDIACTVAQGDAEAAKTLLTKLAAELGCAEVSVDTAIAKVSIVGVGMIGRPGVAARMFAALAAEAINIQMIATSEIRVSCVVAESHGVAALQAIHKAFELSGHRSFAVPA
jgi:aspartate kinase